jgi:phosphoglycerate dehydrogenase-like enzyme
MPARVWLPYADWADSPDVTQGLPVAVYDGRGEPPRGIEQVELFVLPYMFGLGPARLMASMPALTVAQTLTAGIDDVRPLVPAGVTLCNARGVHDASTAELAVTLILSSLRGIPDFVRSAQRGEWDGRRRDSLADRTVLIVGYGSVGEAVERRLAGFECDVRRVARRARDGVDPFESLPSLVPHADVVVLLVPMTDETRRLVDAGVLSRMRDGALLVNVSRGPVVDTDALLAEVVNGRLRAALDVTDPEPLPPDHALWTCPNVLVSPHVGGNSTAFLPRARRLVAEQLARFAAGEPLVNVVSRTY